MNPTAGMLLGDWIIDNFKDHRTEITICDYDLYDQIVVRLPPIMNNDLTLERKLILSVPRFSMPEVDGVSLCNPEFFDTFQAYLIKQSERFIPAVEQWQKDGSLPNVI